MDSLKTFSDSAASLSGGPLGIIALFLVLIYGITALVVVLGSSLDKSQKTPLIFCMALFPVLVLSSFTWLASERSANLYPPNQYKDEKDFLELQKIQSNKLRAGINVALATCQATNVPLSAESIANTVASAPIEMSKAGAKTKSLLWVDDHPEHNIFERQAFEHLGYKVTLAESTAEAIKFLQNGSFSAVITNMKRPNEDEAGYNLLDAMKEKSLSTPLFIYSSSSNPAFVADAISRGAKGETNDPSTLFQLVTSTEGA